MSWQLRDFGAILMIVGVLILIFGAAYPEICQTSRDCMNSPIFFVTFSVMALLGTFIFAVEVLWGSRVK